MNHKFGRSIVLSCVIYATLISRIYSFNINTESTCGKPGLNPNTEYNPKRESYRLHDEVTYMCSNGGLISRPSIRRCSEDSRWLGEIPKCYKPVPMQNARYFPPDVSQNVSDSIDGNIDTCIMTERTEEAFWEGYLLKSAEIKALRIVFPRGDSFQIEVLIKENKTTKFVGIYSGNSISIADGIRHVEVFCPPSTVGNVVHIKDLNQGSHNFRICEVTAYLPKALHCLTPDSPLNGKGFKATSSQLTIFKYSCDYGYKLFGDAEVTCESNGNLSTRQPTCQFSGCGNLPEVSNGVLISNSTEVGSTARLLCDVGFKPLSETSRQCLSNGMWSTESLICIPLRCEENPVVPYGRAIFLDGSTYLGSRLQIICNRGYAIGASFNRTCGLSETWGDMNVCIERTCGSPNFNKSLEGRWLLLNYSIPIWILVCEPGYHTEGFPTATQCLINGSWSYTNAVCTRTLPTNQLKEEWSHNISLVKAIAAGAGTAILILSLARIAIVLKKRIHSKSNTTVFHDGMEDSSVYIAGIKENSFAQEHYYTKATYEDIIELRQKSPATKPRKPRSALPHLPIDTDPVYAQPFENSVSNKKTSTSSNTDDPYTAHIYTEPVDSKIPAISATYIPNCMSEAWFQTGTGKYGRKMSLPSNPLMSKHTEQNFDVQNTLYETSCHDPTLTVIENKMDKIFEKSDLEIHNETPLELIQNTIYIESDNRDFQSHISLKPLQLDDSDMYRDEAFSNV